jgi:broad specificity phosphatase PhoE
MVTLGPTNVVWVRHGENAANLTRTLSFRVVDESLTDRGRRQARELAVHLASRRRLDLVVCSPLRRARETAELVAYELGLRVAAEFEDLREVNVGSLDGSHDAEAWATYDRVLAAWRRGDYAARFPGGEDCFELAARLGRAFQAVADLADGSEALVVAHGANLRAALPLLASVPDPGHDLPTGGVAQLTVTSHEPATSIQLVTWAAAE